MSVDPSYGWAPPFPPILYDKFDDSQQEESEVSEHKIIPIKFQSEPFSNQLADLSTIFRVFLDTNTSIDIDKIRKDYVFLESREMSIETYLSVNSEIRQALIDTRSMLTQYFGEECNPSLLVYVDPEEAFERLFIRVTLHLSPKEAFDARRQFFMEWFSHYPLDVKSHLNIDIRLQ